MDALLYEMQLVFLRYRYNGRFRFANTPDQVSHSVCPQRNFSKYTVLARKQFRISSIADPPALVVLPQTLIRSSCFSKSSFRFPIINVRDSLAIRICSVHRLSPEFRFCSPISPVRNGISMILFLYGLL